ncbi:MAG: VOC family protein [Bacillota bacterium]|nr:VOC family protein [Bacillota bacterium]
MHIKHIAIRVKDLEKSINFYKTMSELTVARRISAGQAELAFLTHGDGETEIELIQIPESQTFSGKGLFICFETDKLEAMHKTAADMGLQPSAIQQPGDGTRYFYVYDPDGVSVQLRVFA